MFLSAGPRPLPPGVVLLLSVKGGDQARTAALLRSGLNPDETRDARGYSALHVAAVHGRAKIARLLVDAGASTETVTSGDRLTPLRLAVDNGHTLTTQALLDAGANMAARDLVDHATPLHAAAEAGHTSLVIELVRRGANLEARAVSGQTPLRWALSLGRAGSATALLESGADPDAPDRRGACCLHAVAAMKPEEGIDSPCSRSVPALAPSPSWSPAALAELLLSAGADPNRGRCPNRSSAPDDHVCAHGSGGDGSGSAISDSGSDGSSGGTGDGVSDGKRGGGGQASVGETPLHVAARESSVQVAEILLRNGADPNARTCAEERGLSPLHCAAAPGGDTRRSIMQVLLRAGADVNATSGDGLTTPLRLSCMNAAAGCVEELLRWGADDVTRSARPSPGLSASSPSSPSSSDRSTFVSASSSATFSSSPPGASVVAAAAPGAATAATAAAAAAATSFAGVHFSPAPPPPPPSVGNIETAPGSNDDELAQHALHCRPNVDGDDPRLRLPPLRDVIGSRVPLSARDVADCRTIHQVLRRMPLDRAWRRRGWLCMLYTRAARKTRFSCSLRGGLSCWASTAASFAVLAGGKPDAHQVVMNPCTTSLKQCVLMDGVSTRSRSSKKTEPGMREVFTRRDGLGVGTSCETRKRKASDATYCVNVRSMEGNREEAEPVACSCAGAPNVDTGTNNLYSANEQAKRPSRAAKRHLVARAGTEEMQRKTFRDLIGRLFEVQGDQSIVRKVIAWL